ncbi:hypothetical protein LCGC14_0663650 [marine sediment metagenome]|uniref:Uncharacterized protein n=1 Tax=marine sediment metagenome TaxID=412755 RepID=A0A0F9RD09_9ZZZZ
MFSDEDKLNDEQISKLVKQLMKRTNGNINVDKHGDFYDNLQTIASELKYIEKPQYSQSILSYNDTTRSIEKIWEYVMKGVLAPGSLSSGYNIFFPYLHLTEKGRKEMEKW